MNGYIHVNKCHISRMLAKSVIWMDLQLYQIMFEHSSQGHN